MDGHQLNLVWIPCVNYRREFSNVYQGMNHAYISLIKTDKHITLKQDAVVFILDVYEALLAPESSIPRPYSSCQPYHWLKTKLPMTFTFDITSGTHHGEIIYSANSYLYCIHSRLSKKTVCVETKQKNGVTSDR